ncbi:MAG TPA: glycogen/starch/alpha-glucan phosphorylase [Opitutaceae bacterium]|nr:glycogen/starch/alpha-glucan phosphorylase [Opitutaceae bacterium]
MKKTSCAQSAPAQSPAEDIRTGLSPASIRRAFCDNLFFLQGRFPEVATPHDRFMALAYTVRDRLLQHWIRTAETYRERRSRTVCYLSAEYLLGPQLGSNLINLGVYGAVEQAMRDLGLNLEDIFEQEDEPGLGNGGLGRLAACFLDSMATLEIPSIAYGIRYEYGIFDQAIRDGWQVELADKWLRLGNPWEVARPELTFDVKLGGRTEAYTEDGAYRVRWIPDRVVRGMAYDTPVLGYRVNTANLLRLWRAEAGEAFDFRIYNSGDYYGAVFEKIVAENITKVLYPNDELVQGKQLRLQQQYFFASCALQDMIRLHLQTARGLDDFHGKFAVQLNDTHPAIAIAELMRLLIDEHRMGWDQAWDVTQNTFGYTNHTLLPEALERWPVPLFGSLLPRHLEIIYEINRRFLDDVRRRYPGDEDRIRRLSLIDESGGRSVRMAHLAAVGSRTVNGVARLHSELLRRGALRDFYDLTPEKFTNVTNGVTPRRFLVLSNPQLAALITARLGDGWIKDLEQLRRLEPLAEEAEFRAAWREIKRRNKARLAELLGQRAGVAVDPDTLFDLQVKRLHEYKRQHLNLLHVIALHNRLRREPEAGRPGRTVIFAGKAAPGYYLAKLIIKLIHAVADRVNGDPAMAGRLRVAFLPDFNVRNAQRLYPAADLSEQISTAGMEASGTGNMKFALNGALTIGTLDGANIEIRDAVGAGNFFLFGLTAPEVRARQEHGYRPRDHYDADSRLREAIDQIASGYFLPDEPDLFQPLVNSLLGCDPFMLLADFASYVECQDRVGAAYQDAEDWTRKSILNTARIGYFSSDRAVREYCELIWRVRPESIDLKLPTG